MGKDCKVKVFARKIDACKLEEIATTNIVIKVLLELLQKFLGLKMTCPMGPIPFRVQIIVVIIKFIIKYYVLHI